MENNFSIRKQNLEQVLSNIRKSIKTRGLSDRDMIVPKAPCFMGMYSGKTRTQADCLLFAYEPELTLSAILLARVYEYEDEMQFEITNHEYQKELEAALINLGD